MPILPVSGFPNMRLPVGLVTINDARSVGVPVVLVFPLSDDADDVLLTVEPS